ncbi:MAG: hypothetical protein WCF04_01065, partial [Candidatus Nanopelagicales bacterium]
ARAQAPGAPAPGSPVEALVALIAERRLARPSRTDAVVDGVRLDLVFDDRRAAVVLARARTVAQLTRSGS